MLIDFLADSDCMYIEDHTAWFVSRLNNILFNLDMKSGCYGYVRVLPEHGYEKWRFHPVCIKHNDRIYCLPDRGKCVWTYHLKSDSFEQIKIVNPGKKRIRMKYLGKYQERLYTVSLGLKQIIVINLKKQEIENTHLLSNNIDEELSENNIMIGKTIYGVLNSSKTIIYEFDIVSMKIKKTIISDRKAFYNTISFDGDKFWLSGSEKEILIWGKNRTAEYVSGFSNGLHILNFKMGCVESVDNLSYIYEPLFSKSLFLSEKIWYIPFRTDKIIYVDKNTLEARELPLPLEEEDGSSIKKRDFLCNYKFFFEYIIAQRYIVIYSLKMECHYIIDTLSMDIVKKPFKFVVNNIENLAEIYKKNKFFNESDTNDRARYIVSFMWGKQDKIDSNKKIGQSIYHKSVNIDSRKREL